jgi:hypothetical protein
MSGSSDGLALVIASISLGISIATFVWRVLYDIYWDAPRLRVILDQRTITGTGMKPVDVYAIEATNTGRRSTTLTSLWLVFGRPPPWWWRIARRVLPTKTREKFFGRAIMMPDQAVMHLATVLPRRFDVGDQAHVYYSRSAVHQSPAASDFKMIYGTAGASTGGRTSRPLRLP